MPDQFVIGAATVFVSGEDGWEEIQHLDHVEVTDLDSPASDATRKRARLIADIEIPLTNDLPIAFWVSWGQPETAWDTDQP